MRIDKDVEWEYTPAELAETLLDISTFILEVTGHRGRGCIGCQICTYRAMAEIGSRMFEDISSPEQAPYGRVSLRNADGSYRTPEELRTIAEEVRRTEQN